MTENKELPTVSAKDQSSILEDASTLLMFHSAVVTNPEPDTARSNDSAPSPVSTQTSKEEDTTKDSNPSSSKNTPTIPTLQLPKNIASPGPGIAALVDSDEEGGEGNQKRKAIVAAAALAAAQGQPIPFAGRPEKVAENQINEEAKKQGKLDEDEHANTEKSSDDNKGESKDIKKAVTDQEIVPDYESDLQDKDQTTDVETHDDGETQDENAETPKLHEEQNKERKPEKKKEITVSEAYIVDPDLGVISCVCGYEDDDGFTIQCDHCNRWQHAVCMGIDSMDNVPDDYLCNICSPRKIDAKKAKAFQAQRLETLKRKRSRTSVNSDSGNDSSSQTTKSSDSTKEERSNSRTQAPAQKPKPKQPSNPYGKNLEESDIPVPGSKDSYLTSFFQLDTYDYQDNQVYNFIQDLRRKSDAKVLELSKSDLKESNLPKIKVKPYSEISSKKFNGISKLGLFTESYISPDSIITEYLGEINFKVRYMADSRNHYRIWGVEKPYVSFIPNTPLVVDARSSGNVARFIRRSCNPNCELAVSRTDESIQVVLVAKKPIKPNSELTVGWNWDAQHPINGLINGNTFDQTNDADKPSLVLSIESILTFVECGCSSNSECFLSKVKKASAHIYRSTRKGNSSSGMRLLQKEANFVSIQERLLKQGLMDLKEVVGHVTTVPILVSGSGDRVSEAEVTIKPYIYNYLTKKRKYNIPEETKADYLPVPVKLLPESTNSSVGGTTSSAPKAVKKLSFADYKKKKKPT